MKTNQFIYILASAILLFASCRRYDVNMHTTINEDGSCSREFKISVLTESQKQENKSIWQKRTLSFNDFVDSVSMCFDNSWKTSWCVKNDTAQNAFPIKDTTLPTDTFLVIAKHDFASVEKMAEAMPMKFNDKPYVAKAELQKTFKWFFTEYTYTETYTSVASEFSVPMSKYLDEASASYWFTGQPNVLDGMAGVKANELLGDIEGKVYRWITANLIYDACDLIIENYDSIANTPLSKKEFENRRDSLVEYSHKQMHLLWENENFLSRMFDGYFGSDVYSQFLDSAPISSKYSELFCQKYGINASVNIEYTLTMPGEIVDAGSGKLLDGMAHYKFGADMFLLNDYTITATSRVTNIWAYVLSVLVILLAVFSFLYKKK